MYCYCASSLLRFYMFFLFLTWEYELNLSVAVLVSRMGQMLFSGPEARCHGATWMAATILTKIPTLPPHRPLYLHPSSNPWPVLALNLPGSCLGKHQLTWARTSRECPHNLTSRIAICLHHHDWLLRTSIVTVCVHINTLTCAHLL